MRLFFALIPPANIRQQLLLSMGGVEYARWQSDEQLHVTVRYVGDVDGPQAELLIAETDRLRFSAIETRLDGAGHFMRRDYVEQLWIGLSPKQPLADLHGKLDRTCVRAGLEPEGRKYVPHITVARLPRSAGPRPPPRAAVRPGSRGNVRLLAGGSVLRHGLPRGPLRRG